MEGRTRGGTHGLKTGGYPDDFMISRQMDGAGGEGAVVTAKGAVFVPFTLQHHGKWSLAGVPYVLCVLSVCGNNERFVCALDLWPDPSQASIAPGACGCARRRTQHASSSVDITEYLASLMDQSLAMQDGSDLAGGLVAGCADELFFPLGVRDARVEEGASNMGGGHGSWLEEDEAGGGGGISVFARGWMGGTTCFVFSVCPVPVSTNNTHTLS